MKKGRKPTPWTLEKVMSRCDIDGDCWLWRQKESASTPTVSRVDASGRRSSMSVRHIVLQLTDPDAYAGLGKGKITASCRKFRCVRCVVLGPLKRLSRVPDSEKRRLWDERLDALDTGSKIVWHREWVPPPKKLPCRSVFEWCR